MSEKTVESILFFLVLLELTMYCACLFDPLLVSSFSTITEHLVAIMSVALLAFSFDAFFAAFFISLASFTAFLSARFFANSSLFLFFSTSFNLFFSKFSRRRFSLFSASSCFFLSFSFNIFKHSSLVRTLAFPVFFSLLDPDEVGSVRKLDNGEVCPSKLQEVLP